VSAPNCFLCAQAAVVIYADTDGAGDPHHYREVALCLACYLKDSETLTRFEYRKDVALG
jgi:hypothetical protein